MKTINDQKPKISTMKKCLFFLASLMMGFSFNSHAYNKFDSTLCLEISGRILNLKSDSNNYFKVELIYNGIGIDSLKVKDKKEFKFELKRNKIYGIRVSKKGYADRIISIDTRLPQYAQGYFRFKFDTELIKKEQSKKLNPDALDFPIALICFNNDMKCFYFNEEYTTYIKRRIYLGEEM
ncbi:MAG: hypothetical protein JWO32_548 [Bacteroidetes bacterium]|nr:hypothetical protein [Bacteroidota bacterium]